MTGSDSTSALQERLQRLEDIEAIRLLKAEYCAGCDDDHNPERLAALFVDDGIWEVAGAARVETRNEGTTVIRDWFQALRDSKRMLRTAHNVFNPSIRIDGDDAYGHWRLIMLYTAATDDSAERYQRIIGWYREHYVRVEGRWRYKHLYCQVEEPGPYSANDAMGSR